MPIFFAPLVGVLVGITLAWISRERARSRAAAAGADADHTPLLVSCELALLVFGPVVLYSIVYYPDWAYLYVVPGARVPSAVDLVLVTLALGSIPAGFFLATRHARTRRLERVAKVAIAPVVLTLALGVAFGRRLSTFATYAQYHGDFGKVPVGQSALGRAILVEWLALAAGLAWATWRLRREVED